MLGAVRDRQKAREALQADLDRVRHLGDRFDRAAVERKLRARLEEWRGLLGRHVAWTRQILAKLITGRIVLTPTVTADGAPAYEARIPFTFAPIFSGILVPKGVASPSGSSSELDAVFLDFSDLLDAA